jgi:ABC-type oligopeptide transport system ATPase subunit
MTPGAAMPLVEIEGLIKHFPVQSGVFGPTEGVVSAVEGIDLAIWPGRITGLVGESGSGKTTVARVLLRLAKPTAGAIRVRNEAGVMEDITTLRGRALKAYRRRVQMIFQDPYESLNPRLTVFQTVVESLLVQGIGPQEERRARVERMLRLVGLTPPDAFLSRYPDALSGGQRQRVAIARALIVEPQVLVADEPTSMLDASIRAGIMDLLRGLTARFGLGTLLITHDLATARYLCDVLVVMHKGQIVEQGQTEDVLAHPQHAYTRALIEATPVVGGEERE